MTDIAPAMIPRPNLRAQRGELSRYENIYPHIRIGKKVIIAIGMSERNAINLFSKDFVFSELNTLPFSIFKECREEKYIGTNENKKYTYYIGYKIWLFDN